jgi:hypothetical protein
VDTQQATNLAHKRAQKRNSLTQYIAAAHNFPNSVKGMRGAIESGELWLPNDMQAPFWRSCDDKPLAYVKRSDENYQALEDRF